MQYPLSAQDIRARRFPVERRRGYQVTAVDQFLDHVARQVEHLEVQLAEQMRSERSAMLLLQQAQQTADRTVAGATSEAEELRARARAEAKQRMDGAEAQIESAFADASERLNEVEREIQARRRELAMLEAGTARFAADQAIRMRQQADALLTAADSITSAGSADVVDALVIESAAAPLRLVEAEDVVDVR
jgi:DivIVA domain-containing protein